MIILGLNVYHPDSAACIIKDNKLIFAIEEERINRLKHYSGLPLKSITECLIKAKVDFKDIDFISINTNPRANRFEKIKFVINNFDLNFLKKKIIEKKQKKDFVYELEKYFSSKNLIKKVFFVEHHEAHVASAVFSSEFKNSANLSIDAFGDFVSTTMGFSKNKKIHIENKIFFPHSLGVFYEAFTQHLGFKNYGDEYKLMGLSGYGKPTEINKIKKIINIEKNGKFKLNLNYFRHHKNTIAFNWFNGIPKTDKLFSNLVNKVLDSFDNTSLDSELIRNYASSIQYVYEEIYFNLLNNLYKKYKIENLTLSGGCAQNSLANGKITKETNFKQVYIPPNPGDGGGALGSAFQLNYVKNNLKPEFYSKVYLGSNFSNDEISKVIKKYEKDLNKLKVQISLKNNFDDVVINTVDKLISKKVIGWFQDQSEFGPRALGNRSIICDPRGDEIKDLINKKIKKRENFRPFAPSVLIGEVHNWFDLQKVDEPYMSRVFPIKNEKKYLIPAVVHCDGTGRLQTVEKLNNKKFFALIEKFFKITGVPILLNTSFNENEPIVNSPNDAIECFLRTDMDVLVMENFILEKFI